MSHQVNTNKFKLLETLKNPNPSPQPKPPHRTTPDRQGVWWCVGWVWWCVCVCAGDENVNKKIALLESSVKNPNPSTQPKPTPNNLRPQTFSEKIKNKIYLF
mgnify:CR=1 FL=1